MIVQENTAGRARSVGLLCNRGCPGDGGGPGAGGRYGCGGDVSVLRSDRCRKRGWEPLVFLAVLSHRATGYEVLQLFISSQAKHFLAAAGRISRAQIFVHNIEELLELERRAPG